MKKIAFLLILTGILNLSAQTMGNNPARRGAGSSGKESFEEFRNRIHNNYNEFRKTILEHYADFLNGEWHEYESLNGLKRDETPKPQEAPRVDLPDLPKPPAKPTQPTPEKPSLADNKDNKPATPAQPKEPEKPVVAENKPATPAQPKEPEKPVVAENKPATPTQPKEPEKPVVAENKPSAPTTPVAPSTPAAPSPFGPGKSSDNKPSGDKNGFSFTFYEMPMSMVDINFSISNNLATPSDFSTQWKNLEADKVGERLLPSIKKSIEKLGLNDYLTYKYLESYVNAKFPNSSNSARMALVHYFLVHLGYDARIAVTGKGTPLLLLPFQQTVYGNSFLSLNNTRYYIYPPEGYDVNTLFSEKVMTCQLPTGVDTGQKFDLVLGELNIPMKPKAFDLEYGPVHLTGEMNENLIPILYRYPQMPIGDYAKSNLQPGLRDNLTQQLKSQIGSMPDDEGVEALLHFTQNAFQYATDDDYHGFEKPYFVEETLFYPKNDCEDRAIFYTYFLWNALGREAQLVSFPGHEAATVVLSNPKNGVSYNENGKTFYISDPTYIGASSGMVMPSYINVKPEVDYTYSKK